MDSAQRLPPGSKLTFLAMCEPKRSKCFEISMQVNSNQVITWNVRSFNWSAILRTYFQSQLNPSVWTFARKPFVSNFHQVLFDHFKVFIKP